MSATTHKHESALPIWEGPAIGLLDLDAFFASVELLDHPEWQGLPLIVGGSSAKRGVVSTASYEARKYGVHSAMPSAQAERLCPNAIWVQGNYARYREMSNKVMDILATETPLVEQVSIDEAFFDVSPGVYSNENPIEICRRIQAKVDELGITCSIGLGPNKTVAKIASDQDKPHGLTIVYPGGAAEFLAPLLVRDMSGIGKAAQARLKELGIKTLGQLAQADPKFMLERFGVYGPKMVERAAGLEQSKVRPIDAPDDVKSVSNERTFAHDLDDEATVHAALSHVGALVGKRLRAKALKGKRLTLKIKSDATHTRTAQTQLPYPTDNEADFIPLANKLLHELWEEGQPIRLIGIALADFSQDEKSQLELFDTAALSGDEQESNSRIRSTKARKLAQTTDEIAKKFGSTALSRGSDMRLTGNTGDTLPQNKS